VTAVPPRTDADGTELRRELADLRHRYRDLLDAAAANEEILRRSLDRELRLMRAETLPELLYEATTGLEQSYALVAISLVIEDPSHELRHLLVGLGEPPDELIDVHFTDSLAGITPLATHLMRPWLGPYRRADHDLLFAGGETPGSVALVPLLAGGRPFALLCLGAFERERFSAELGSDFLQRLGTVLAVCLENAANRARVLRSGLADYLTGWQSRRYLHARLREELARAGRQGTPVACVMVDVDHFKSINDTYGHLAGDAALREITARIESQMRASDTAARFGGDEFALLLPGSTVAAAALFAERIRQAVEPPVDLGAGRSARLTLSIGVAAAAPDRADRDLKGAGERLLSTADEALYRAKALGRNRVELVPDA
jgi:two-component system, cell cycle response regulator